MVHSWLALELVGQAAMNSRIQSTCPSHRLITGAETGTRQILTTATVAVESPLDDRLKLATLVLHPAYSKA